MPDPCPTYTRRPLLGVRTHPVVSCRVPRLTLPVWRDAVGLCRSHHSGSIDVMTVGANSRNAAVFETTHMRRPLQ
ncbi:hypothetical protein CBR_g39206 [Chara braunii]|uniref:Uncharacterized protein n=1 Tax=Chara braunii TaxID=69332 RepID=A0A388LRD5_CHABU|nr:hypothetical protein CBR_g39206 [Chara braunii]|eukprot:GBG84831.1 hypothetical protein CBR_g39206 [Chara braunii]